MGHGVPTGLSHLRVGLESCHLGEERGSLALVLLLLLDSAPLWLYAVIWEGFTQVPSVRWFCQPHFGSVLPLQSVRGHSDCQEKQSGFFRGRITLCPQQLCQFIGFIPFKLRVVTGLSCWLAVRADRSPCFRKAATLAVGRQAIHLSHSGVPRGKSPCRSLDISLGRSSLGVSRCLLLAAIK